MSATTGLFGEGGNDLFKVEPDNFGADAFDGGTGTDTVDFDSLVLPAEIDLQTQTLNDGIAKGDSSPASRSLTARSLTTRCGEMLPPIASSAATATTGSKAGRATTI